MTQPGLWAEPEQAPTPADVGTPQWLAEHIRTTTGADPGARWAWHGRCPRCKARTLQGLNDIHLAWTIRVDPAPLGPVGEALALLAGRETAWLRWDTSSSGARRLALTRRDRWDIGAPERSLMWRSADVVAVHVCDAPRLPPVPSRLKAAVRPTLDTNPPF